VLASFTDYRGRTVRLTEERLAHIQEAHPELSGFEAAIGETLQHPNSVVQSLTNPHALLYYRWYEQTAVGAKYLCVVVILLADDAFIASAYLRETIRRGTLVWTSNQ
jgi:hypothetical protein